MSQPANDDFSQHLSDDEASYHEDASENGTTTNKPKQQQQQLIPTTTTISNIKLPILKKEEYDIWAMEMEHYLEYIDNDVWKVIQNGNSKKRISTGKDSVVRIFPPVSAAEIRAVEKERKARTILLMAIPKEHMRRFHGMDDAKEIWEAIRTSSEGLEKGYDRFQQLLSQLEAHGAEVSIEDANHKFLRSLPPAWSNLAMTMRTKPDVDTLSIDDLYNNVRVFEQELTSTSKSSTSAQNVAFVSHSKSINNKVKSGHTSPYSTYTPSTSLNNIPEREVPAGFADEVIYSLFAKQSEDLDLLHEDLEHIDDVDIKEMDINWQIAMIAIRMKKFYKKTGRKELERKNKIRTLKTLCDEQTNQLGEQEAKILAYTLAVKKLEAQVVTFQKQQLSLNEQLTFQANEIYAKDEKLKKYRRIGMKAVKEKEQLQKIVDSWKNYSKNLWKLVDSGMTSTSKVGLGYEIQSNNEVLSYKEEMKRIVFKCTEEDFLNKPLYSGFSKTDSFKGPEISDSDNSSNEHSSCQSNDSEGSFGNPSEHSSESESESLSVPKEMSTSKSVTTNEKVVSEPKSTEVEPSCVIHVKTPRKQMKNQETPKVKGKNWNKIMERELGEGYSFIKKKCFVCGSLSHLIKDCDFYEKKMAREAELKKQRVFNTGNGMAKPVWNNANRVNRANHFVPRPVQLNVVRSNVNTGRANVNIVRANVNSVRQNVNSVRTNINTVRSKQPVPTNNTNSFSPVRPQGNWSTTVKTSAGYNWRRTRPNSNYNSGSNFVRIDHPLKNIEDRGIFDSGCSRHMTGNKDHLNGFEECKWGSVTFGGSKGYITGQGRIRILNEKSENILKVPRQHNMYSFDMKTPSLTKDYACLIAKATSDESKLWHMRFQMSSMGELIFFLGLQVKQKTDGNFISQDKYVADMLKKFDLTSVKTAITPMETKMALTKDEEADEVDVTPKTSHLNAVKRIFKYLKGKPNLGLWYPRESSFDLEAYSDSDYAGANLDRKSTTGGCQFLGSRLISWQCKKQTIVATSTTEAEYVAAASCCGQVLWIQNQMLDYGFNFMNTKIHIDNESTICIVKNPVYHSKTKHIEIRHHFIRDSYKKKLIRVEKIHTDFNVADLLTKAFDGPRFNFLVVNIGQADQAGTQSQPLFSTVPPPHTSQPAPTESTTIPPTPITKPTSEASSPSTAPEHETMEHPFEQPSPEHQPSSPRQESDIPQT
ncbi:putative ribonuclease H-like domain-containing protein [Tanacetum coccineum]